MALLLGHERERTPPDTLATLDATVVILHGVIKFLNVLAAASMQQQFAHMRVRQHQQASE